MYDPIHTSTRRSLPVSKFGGHSPPYVARIENVTNNCRTTCTVYEWQSPLVATFAETVHDDNIYIDVRLRNAFVRPSTISVDWFY